MRQVNDNSRWYGKRRLLTDIITRLDDEIGYPIEVEIMPIEFEGELELY